MDWDSDNSDSLDPENLGSRLVVEFILLFGIAFIFVAIVIRYRQQVQRSQLNLPKGKTVYLDNERKEARTLYAPQYRLKGRPDQIVQQNGNFIPIDRKTGKTPFQPYQNQIMQVIAYCVLVEAEYGVRPPYGVLQYKEKEFQIEFTPEREQELVTILAVIRQKRKKAEVHRSHNKKSICRACNFSYTCDEYLD